MLSCLRSSGSSHHTTRVAHARMPFLSSITIYVYLLQSCFQTAHDTHCGERKTLLLTTTYRHVVSPLAAAGACAAPAGGIGAGRLLGQTGREPVMLNSRWISFSTFIAACSS